MSTSHTSPDEARIILVPASQLARKVGVAPVTLGRFLVKHGIEPDSHLRSGSKMSPLYRESRWAKIRQDLGINTTPEVIT